MTNASKNKLQTSWFKLENYNGLSKLDLEGWYWQLSMRWLIRSCINGQQYSPDPPIKDLINKIKNCPIFEDQYDSSWFNQWKKEHPKYPFNTYSVMSMPAWFLYEESLVDYPDILEACSLRMNGKADNESMRLSNTPYSILLHDDGIVCREAFTPVLINLEATNDQIEDDFRRWLVAYRNQIGFSPKNISKKFTTFTDDMMADWVADKLLPYLDLKILAWYENKIIESKSIGSLIFPGEEVVETGKRTRVTIKPKAEWLLNHATILSIKAQLAESI